MLWDQVAQWLDQHGQVTNREVRQLTGLEDSVRVSRLLQTWVEQGWLVPRGLSKRDRHYVRPSPPEPSLF
jgi:predicted HTH transcriptional regulator